VPARGHLVLSLTTVAPPSADRVPLELFAGGGELELLAPDGSPSDRLVFGSQAVDFSAARQPDGGETWAIVWNVTPGEANSAEPPATHAEDPSAPPEMVPAAGDLSDLILGYRELPRFNLLIDDDGIAALEQRPYEYVPGSIVYEGREYGPIGIRLKGQNSFRPIGEKPSFRLNIDEYVGRAKFFDLANVTINNMHEDFSMMHERLAYLVARMMGPASRASHAQVELNGEHYGLYTHVETVKRRMIRRWYGDDEGTLYEATDVDFTSDLIDSYEHEMGPDDRELLFDLAAALTNSDADAAIAEASAYVDMESFWQYWALCAVIGQFDGFPYSLPGDDYFIYIDSNSGKISFLPWGMDETFYSSSFPVDQINSVLAERCAASPGCFQEFVDRVWVALDMIEEIDLATERRRVAAEIAPHVSMDTRKAYDDATVIEYQTQQGYFIEGRRAALSAQLPPPSGGQ
jgi:hypothetical protein